MVLWGRTCMVQHQIPCISSSCASFSYSSPLLQSSCSKMDSPLSLWWASCRTKPDLLKHQVARGVHTDNGLPPPWQAKKCTRAQVQWPCISALRLVIERSQKNTRCVEMGDVRLWNGRRMEDKKKEKGYALMEPPTPDMISCQNLIVSFLYVCGKINQKEAGKGPDFKKTRVLREKFLKY